MNAEGPSIAAEQRQGSAAVDGSGGAAVTILALCVGAAIPLAVLGKAVLGVALAPAVLIALWALARGDLRQAVLRTILCPTGLAFCLFGAVSLVSVLLSEHVPKSLETWARTVAFVLFGVIAAHLLGRNRHALGFARRILVVASLLAMGYVVVAVFVSEEVLVLIALGTEIEPQPSLNFKGFASAVVCLLPVALWASAGPGLASKALRLSLLGLAALSVWLDGDQVSLAAILGITCAVLLVGLVRLLGFLSRRFRLVVVGALVLAGLTFAGAVTAALPTIDDDETASLSIPSWLIDGHRQYIWAFTVAATQQRPVFGYGPNTINRIEGADRFVPKAALLQFEGGRTFLPSHPHNWVYEIASETGLVGLGALFLGLVLLLRRLAVLALNGYRAGWAGVALFGSFWGSSLVNFSIWAAWWQLTFVVLLAILMAVASPPASDAR